MQTTIKPIKRTMAGEKGTRMIAYVDAETKKKTKISVLQIVWNT